MASVALILIALAAVLTAFAVVWHHRRQRVTAITLQLNLQRLDFDLQRLAERRARAARRAKLASRAATLHDKLTVLEPYTSLHPPPPPDAGAFTTWHALAPDGGCPAPIPAWDWRTFLRAAQATSARERQEALGALHAASRVPEGQLMRLAQSYDAKLRAREFVGILDAPHPPCGGRAFARVEGDRLLRLDCPDGYGRYALDDHAELREYTGPVRLGDAEAVVAFCGREPRMLLAHPKFEPSLVARARAALPPPWSAPRLPSVLVLMVDATSRAHFRRSLPLTLAALEELGTPRRNKPPPPHVFDFEHYNIVGYNSIPNQMPLFCNVAAEELHSLRGDACVWEAFKRRGAVTAIVDEVHDRCESPTSPIHAIERQAWAVRKEELPDHQYWRVFCSPHIEPCCWSKTGFLNPGRRQCAGGGRELHEVMLGYVEEFWAEYADAPRRWASVNTMVAHEHFMLRLPSLDADLAAAIRRLRDTVLQDTVLFLLSDHGTHGIWYTDYEIGAAEHKLPFMYVVAPDWLMKARPDWRANLQTNQRRLVTVREVYHAMLRIAAFPDDKAGGPPSLLDPIPAGRTCRDAQIPEKWCACKVRNGGGEEPAAPEATFGAVYRK